MFTRYALAAALLLTTTPALARYGEPDQVRVRHADLDLRLEADRKILNRRLKNAVRTVCDGPAAISEIRFCFYQAKQDVERQLATVMARVTAEEEALASAASPPASGNAARAFPK